MGTSVAETAYGNGGGGNVSQPSHAAQQPTYNDYSQTQAFLSPCRTQQESLALVPIAPVLTDH